ncbi:MAG: Ribosomal RNA small subunit methyltransferase E [Chroococcidiopsis cubana SAG 39.79]|jgi:16S rRNA (uracil1498-N3)-methyltransferase|uniref:Ribosomal RNA small subunit methyltransferase E n=1 Tax=Chroococcidiopsis cubana SAG 39.79 TaxID=388085 RepID=A0AB37UNQ7_9CYAN|nr:16S rRNA (uracil(1498)-N(3))-methyltransferase [Chroococcidiopsis cubana]MDZ4871208.1 Ribosomal RNA small subunit methyltransferase E [Chroococcidiopsis cubana SAG 39.79]PSB61048.1 16S rRNA (uracil(1498)-N(3))-methyltransferase [Chroococcidiopsis cubana CCALA 043]RUT13025.1 ribosomal RNA small subunit methyltransferase E [Chroococcidiopsis cubana SAG 39.79]
MSQLQRIVIAPAQLQQQQIALTSQQQHYLTRVLRLRQGDRFIAMDGKGQWWLAVLAETTAQILEQMQVQTELPVEITLMVALPKGNGFDEVVRACTELGVNCFAPVTSDRTLLHPSPQKLDRWRRIAIEAAEQSERQIVPTILDPVPFSTGLLSVTGDRKYICVARGNSPHLFTSLQSIPPSPPSKGGLQDSLPALSGELDSSHPPLQENSSPPSQGNSSPPLQGGLGGSIVIATGAEGGWTTNEVENAIAAGFQPVSLGKRILRAVTAPIVAVSQISAIIEMSRNSENPA